MNEVVEHSNKETAKRDTLLLKLLKTPPQPRPKRERGKKTSGDRRQSSKG